MGVYYSNTKLFHFPEHLVALERGSLTAPVHIRIKPTNRCNHRCWYCGYQNDSDISLGENLHTRDQIPLEKMNELCEDLPTMGVKAVTFSGGGEPLTYTHIEDFAKKLVAGGVQVAMLTNGALLRGRKAEAFADSATWVRVSMDGWDDESYRRYRGVGDGQFSLICRNLESFARIKGKTVLGVSLNVDRDNCSHILQFAQKIKDLGVDHLKISGCVVHNDGHANNRYHEPFQAVVQEQIQQVRSQLEDHRFGVMDAYHQMPDRFEKSYTQCHFSRFLTIIAADLNVYTCQDKAYTDAGKLGSIRDQRFIDFWSGAACHRALSAINPSITCRHHCVADGKNRMLVEYLSHHPDHLSFV